MDARDNFTLFEVFLDFFGLLSLAKPCYLAVSKPLKNER